MKMDDKNYSVTVGYDTNVSNISSNITDEILYDGDMMDPKLQLVITLGLVLIVTFGLLGNIMVMFTLIFTKAYRQTTTSAFVLNLSFADLLFLLFCVPFQGVLYVLNNWPFGLMWCKVAHFFQHATAFASVWLLTVMSIDRYLAIGHPLKSVNWRNPSQAFRVSFIVWTISATLSLPCFWLYGVMYIPQLDRIACFPQFPDIIYDNKHWIYLVVFLSGFAVPSVIIFIMALLVACTLAGTLAQPLVPETTPGGHRALNKKRKRVAWLVFALSVVFFVCYLPQNISIVWMNFGTPSFDAPFMIYKVFCHVFTYLNSCVNPVLYSLLSEQFRSKLLSALAGKRHLSASVQRPRNRANSSKTNVSPDKLNLRLLHPNDKRYMLEGSMAEYYPPPNSSA